MKLISSFLVFIIFVSVVSCKKDSAPAGPVNYPLPSSYSFSNTDSNAARTILSMVSQMEAYITTGNTPNIALSADRLKSMLANTGGYLRDTTVSGVTLALNASGVNIKSLIAPSAEAYVETIFDSVALSSQSTVHAANGIAGVSADKKTLLSANGVYWRQLFTKTIMGVLLQHLTTDTYLSDSLHAGSTAAKTHAWDQAFFLWAVPVNFPANRAGVKYWGSYASQIDSGVNKPVVNLTGINSVPSLMTAFLNGRVALNNNDLLSAETSAASVIALYEKMEGAAALHELNEAIGNIPNGASAVVGNISESRGFINAWKYNTKRKIATDAQVAAIEAMYKTNFYNLTQADLEGIKTAISSIYQWDAVKAFL